MKQMIGIGLLVGSTAGSFVPYLWGDNSLFSFSSLFFGAAGGVLGIYIAFKLTR